MPYTIRPFREDDRAAVIEGRNKGRPAHHQRSIAEWQADDARKPAGEVSLQLCVGEPAFAYLSVVDRGTTARRKPGVVGFELWIAPDRWSREIADALYAKVVKFARSREARRLAVYLTLYTPDDSMAAFLTRHGFTEVDRLVPIMLDLVIFDSQRFVAPIPNGITFFSYAKAGDNNENRHKLYTLAGILDRDAPTNDVRSEPPPFEEFAKHFDRPEWNNDALILAASDSGKWIGASQLRFQEHSNIAWTFLTVILPEYRGLGIAFALKLRTIDAAIARGSPLILTENHEDNAPMRAINKKLGFVPDAQEVRYSRELEPLPLVPRSLPC